MKNQLKALRAARNWTQSDLAELLEVSRQTVNAVETEKYEPSLTLAFKIAALFEMRIEEIFESPSAVVKTKSKSKRVQTKVECNAWSLFIRPVIAAQPELLQFLLKILSVDTEPASGGTDVARF